MPIFGKFNPKMIAILMIVSGSICLIAAATWSIHSWHLVSTAARATGHITELVERPSKDGTFFYPVFTYADQRGVEHKIYSSVGTYPPPNQVGDTVTVLYSPGAEQNAQLDDWSTIWGIPIFLASLGVADSIMGIVVHLWPRITRRMRPTPE